MSKRTLKSLVLAASAASAALSLSAPAQASLNFTRPNYVFPDGAAGFLLHTSGGPVNPGVIAGFNPQPEPPGDNNISEITLLNPTTVQIFNPSTDGAFNFLIALLLPGDGSVIPLPDAPNRDGFTRVDTSLAGHDISISLLFGPGPVDPASWVGFNPQPEPPGDFIGGSFSFEGPADPWVDFRISVDGTPLTFTVDGVPEPASWALLLTGFGGLGAALRLQRRRRALALV